MTFTHMLDFLAAIFVISAVIALYKRKAIGWGLNAVGSALYFGVGVLKGLPGLCVVSAVLCALDLWIYWRWPR